MDSPDTHARPRRRRAPWPVLASVAVIAVIAVLSVAPVRTPSPRPVTAPTDQFSADRAAAVLEHLATGPRPTGSTGIARVRDQVEMRLRTLGLTPRELSRPVAGLVGDSVQVGTVTDLLTPVLTGTASTGRVLLVAHLDSVPIGPGASDDAANVATLLEVVRVLQAGPRPRNDVDLLLTDGEEQAQLGAALFVDADSTSEPRTTAVVNLEARGTSGPALLFQVVGPGLVPAVRASGAFTTSFADAVYGILPNDTDLTTFDRGGLRGLNLAFVGGASDYHTAHDDLAHVDRGSIQDMGDAALGAARALGDQDLGAQPAEATWFSVVGFVVSYPDTLAVPLAVVVAGLYVALLVVARRRRGGQLRGALTAAGTLAAPVLAAAAAGLLLWEFLRRQHPEFDLVYGNVPHLGRYVAAEALLLGAAVVAWYRWTGRRSTPLGVSTGVLGWFVVLGVACAVALPGGAYLFVWPALAGVVVTALLLWRTSVTSTLRVLGGTSTAVVAVALLVPVAVLLFPTLGLSLTAAPLVLFALVAAPAVVLLEPLATTRFLRLLPVAGVLAAVVVTAVATTTDGYDSRSPEPVSLGYLFDADTSSATWISAGGTGQPVVGPLLDGGSLALDDRIPFLGGPDYRQGAAPVSSTNAAPSLDVGSDVRQDSLRTVQVRLRTAADTYAVHVYVDTSTTTVVRARVDGLPVGGGDNVDDDPGVWRWGLNVVDPGADGVTLELVVRGGDTLRLRAVTSAAGFPADVGAPELGADLAWAPWPSVAGVAFVSRTFTV